MRTLRSLLKERTFSSIQYSAKLLSEVLKQYTIQVSENVMGRGPVVLFPFD